MKITLWQPGSYGFENVLLVFALSAWLFECPKFNNVQKKKNNNLKMYYCSLSISKKYYNHAEIVGTFDT